MAAIIVGPASHFIVKERGIATLLALWEVRNVGGGTGRAGLWLYDKNSLTLRAVGTTLDVPAGQTVTLQVSWLVPFSEPLAVHPMEVRILDLGNSVVVDTHTFSLGTFDENE
jgi:hypothetical protein